MAFDPSSLLGALIGAGAALSGTFLNQRSERKKAAVDRIWEARASTYSELFEWTSDLHLYLLQRRRFAKDPSVIKTAEKIYRIKNVYATGLQVRASIYSSDKVHELFHRLLSVAIEMQEFPKAEDVGQELASKVIDAANAGSDLCLKLETRIRAEMNAADF